MNPPILRRSLLATLGMVAVVVSACAAAPAPTVKANPENGGTAYIGVGADETSFLNAGIIAGDQWAYSIDAPVVEGLLWPQPTSATATASSEASSWQPDLATQIPTVANGDVRTSGCATPGAAMCVTWKLRSHVQWDDGSTFSSKDVCATFDFFWLKYGNNNPTALVSTNGWNLVDGCVDAKPDVAEVDFSQAYGPYLTLGSSVYGILPASLLDQAFSSSGSLTAQRSATNPVAFASVNLTKGSHNPAAFVGTNVGLDSFLDGTGPFVFKSYVPGQQYVFVRNDNYWDKAHEPHLNEIVMTVEPSVSAQVNAVESGDVQASFDLQLDNLQGLINANAAGTLALQVVPDSGAEMLAFNTCGEQQYWVGGQSLCGPGTYSEYTADPVIREAIRGAIDRTQLVNQVALNRTTVPQDSALYLGANWIKDPVGTSSPYDPTAAEALLDSHGYTLNINCDGGHGRAYSDGTCIRINLGTTSTSQYRQQELSLIAADLQNIGIQVITPSTPSAPGSQLLGPYSAQSPAATHQFDMLVYSDTLGSPAYPVGPDAPGALTPLVSPGEPNSYLFDYFGCTATTAASACTTSDIPSHYNGGAGTNYTGINDAGLNSDLLGGYSSVSPKQRQAYYVDAEKVLADQVADIPLYQQMVVNAYGKTLHGVETNDLIWDLNTADWYCTNGKCQNG